MPRKSTKTSTKKVAVIKQSTPPPSPTPPEKVRRRYNHVVIFSMVLLLFLFTFTMFSFYWQQNFAKQSFDSPTDELEMITFKISQFMDLPKDETPTLATVLDQEKLSSQDFFQNARNGDKLLVYEESNLAILYRPSTNRIVTVAPVFEEVKESTEDPDVPPRIAYYNGTLVKGFASEAAKKISEAYPDYQTELTGNATLRNYTKTIVVDIAGLYLEEAENIARILEGEVRYMPEGEKLPDADILVILGK